MALMLPAPLICTGCGGGDGGAGREAQEGAALWPWELQLAALREPLEQKGGARAKGLTSSASS
jgi:hypothetical protein